MPAIRIGDRFTKAGDRFGKVWEVSRIWIAVDGLLHARLTGQNGQGETQIISVVTLSNSDFFSAVPAARDNHRD